MTTVEEFSGRPAEWDAFVQRCPGWTHYHLYGWRRVLERVFSLRCSYLAARAVDGALSGVLPLVRVRSAMFGDYLVSMPFLSYGGPLGDEESIIALSREAAEIAKRVGTDLLELRSRVTLPIPLQVSHRKSTVLLDLPAEADHLWRSLDAKVRSQIRRPRKEGVEIRFGLNEMDAFFRVFSRHMRDLGTPTQPRGLYEALAGEFRDSIWFGAAYLDGRPIAAGCGFAWNQQFELVWAASLREYNRIAPNMLLYWSFLERCIAEGLRTFDFGRCSPGSGTHRFKLQWGGRDQPLWWYQVSRERASTPSPDDARFRWGPRLWQRLPVRVATMLGPRIVRYLP